MFIYEHKDYTFTLRKENCVSLHAKNRVNLLEYENNNVTSPCCIDIYSFLKRNCNNEKLRISLNGERLNLEIYVNEDFIVKITLYAKENNRNIDRYDILNNRMLNMRREMEADYIKKLESMKKNITFEYENKLQSIKNDYDTQIRNNIMKMESDIKNLISELMNTLGGFEKCNGCNEIKIKCSMKYNTETFFGKSLSYGYYCSECTQ